jgi:iron uptake system EfeUOB component EfeO/EfeM
MHKRWLATGLVIAVAALMIGAMACSSKKSAPNPTSTKTSETAMAHETPTAEVTAMAGETPETQSEVAVTLVEYKVVPVPTSVPAGSVTFNIKNIGSAEHELHVIKTDLAPEALPTKADGSVDEEAAGVTMVDHVPNIAAGQATPLTVKLEPGAYVLICNLVQTTNGTTVSHYAEGMHVAFTITP